MTSRPSEENGDSARNVADRLLGLQRADRGDPLPGGDQHHEGGEHDDARRQGDLGRTLLGGLAHPAIVPSAPQRRSIAAARGGGGFLRVALRDGRGLVPDAREPAPPRGLDP